ncbi:MAG: hypothetical protein FJX47_15355, partial [Alphaproteobacteria bacterium]|nr:hypothetical protein [Alphaproteobacteria bacterium]
MAAASSKALFEFIDNPESRSPVLLILDCSKGMDGAPLKAFAAGLAAFRKTVLADRKAALRVELAVVSIGDGARLVRPFATLDDASDTLLSAAGRRDLGAGLDLAIEIVDQRKAAYNAHGVKYRRPWFFLV